MRILWLSKGGRSGHAVIGFLVCACLLWISRPALATDTGCLCNLIRSTFAPELVDGKWVLNDLTPAQMEAFAEAAQACGAGSGHADCGPFEIAYSIKADGDESDATATAAPGDDLSVAVGGDSDNGEADGGDATATNAQSGGAAVAVGGEGGEGVFTDGGNATAAAGGGEAAAQGGEGGDPTDNPTAGGDGGDASATSTGCTSATGNGCDVTSEDDGMHGTGGSASTGPSGPSSTNGTTTANV